MEPFWSHVNLTLFRVLHSWGSLLAEISGQAEFFPLSRLFQPCKVVVLRAVVCIATEQESQRRFLLLRQLNDRLCRLLRVARLLAVVIALKPRGRSNC